ncbi:SMP-30/gluconolactonase/LRE family protein [Arthrobacter sp. NA-172]|uniref:SMP-30/gluconolactonase/LRE family protein n=1 Tax=Arthrobacter sp. NA-172 TaxID=3367524 RepID=UPI003754F144
MKSKHVDIAIDAAADLAEGPWWDEQRQELLWVDIFAGRIHVLDPASGLDRSIDVGQPIGMVARRQSGGLVCAVRDGIVFIHTDGNAFELAVPIESAIPGNRMNDGACDPAGRLWAGTMATDLSPSAGSLYRISSTLQVTPVLSNVSISNGLDWSPDGQTFYFTDSTTKRLDAYDFDIDTGEISNGRVLVDLPDPIATPDGIAVDAEGTIWVAMWDGGCVHRFSTKGRLLETLDLPVTRPTSVAFGGPALNQLFITSARNGLTPRQLQDQPHAGAIFVLEPGVTGRSPYSFRG